jgi:hypothetical protein
MGGGNALDVALEADPTPYEPEPNAENYSWTVTSDGRSDHLRGVRFPFFLDATRNEKYDSPVLQGKTLESRRGDTQTDSLDRPLVLGNYVSGRH